MCPGENSDPAEGPRMSSGQEKSFWNLVLDTYRQTPNQVVCMSINKINYILFKKITGLSWTVFSDMSNKIINSCILQMWA